MHATSLSKTSRAGTVKKIYIFLLLDIRRKVTRTGKEVIRMQLEAPKSDLGKCEVKVRKAVVGSKLATRKCFYRHPDKTASNRYPQQQIRVLATHCCVCMIWCT